MTYRPQYNRTGSVAASSANSGTNTGDQDLTRVGLAGDGFVTMNSWDGRAAVSLSGMLCVPELDNKVYFITTATNGILHVLDKITREAYALATFASKALLNIIYSPNAGRLLVNYGANTMSVNPTTGAIVTAGIAKDCRSGMCIRETDGVLYGYNGTDVVRIDTVNDVAVGSSIAVTGSGNASTRKNITRCPTNDSVYVYTNIKISRINCLTNAEAASISPAGMAGGNNSGSVAYSAWCDKVFAACGTCLNLIQIDPSIDAQEAAYPFPPGSSGSGSTGMIALGRYLFVGVTGATNPNEVLIFDCENLEWVGALNAIDGSSQATGNVMCGEQGDVGEFSYLYAATSGSGWVMFGG